MTRIFSRRSRFFSRLNTLALSLFLLTCLPSFAENSDKAIGDVLSAAERLFQKMQAKDYASTWGLLSSESQRTILGDTRKAIAQAGGKEVPEEDLRKDFESGGPIATGYWNGFLTHFDPNLALERSTWEMGPVKAGRAEIRITSKTAEKPALLKLYREEGRWKVGLVETFWGRK